jgi:hypothetical protein
LIYDWPEVGGHDALSQVTHFDHQHDAVQDTAPGSALAKSTDHRELSIQADVGPLDDSVGLAQHRGADQDKLRVQSSRAHSLDVGEA